MLLAQLTKALSMLGLLSVKFLSVRAVKKYTPTDKSFTNKRTGVASIMSVGDALPPTWLPLLIRRAFIMPLQSSYTGDLTIARLQ